MKNIILAWVALTLFAAAPAYAATDYYLKLDGVKGESSSDTRGTTRASTTGSVDSGTDEGKKGGNVEFEWKVEEGESAAPALMEIDTIKGESKEEGKESGEKGGTEDINIGVGELQEGKVNKVDAITIKQTVVEKGGELDVKIDQSRFKGGINIAVGDVNGLTEEEKQTFLAQVKAHAEVQSEQDLQNFARGVLLENAAMEEMSLNFEKIKTKYRSSGKLFGFLPVSFSQEVEVDTEGDDFGRVKVTMPWYSFLLKPDVPAAELESAIGVSVGDNDNWNFGAYASVVATISNVLKTKHDTAKNAIGNIR